MTISVVMIKVKIKFGHTPFLAADASVNAGADHLLAALSLDPAHAVVVDGARSGLTCTDLSQHRQDVQLVSDGFDLSGQA